MKRAAGAFRWMDLAVAALLVAPLLLAGMGRALGLSEQGPVFESEPNPRVAIVRASGLPSDAAIETMVRQALDLALGAGGVDQIISAGDTVLLKVNLGTGLDAHEITSWQVARAVALACQEAGAAHVIIGEGPELGIGHYAEAGYVGHLTGVEYLDFNAASTSLVPVHIVQPLWATGQDLIMPRPYLDADVVISIPKMKTHSTGGVTLSLKNAIGVPPVAAYRSAPDRAWRDLFHSQYGVHKTIVQINQARKPDLAVIDAILSGEGSGPWGASPIETNMVLVSRDPVAADAVATASMGFDPERVRHLVYAAFKGLGQVHLEQIEVVGASLDSVRRPFAPPSNVARLFRRAAVLGVPPQGFALDGNLAEWESSPGLWVHRPGEVQEGAAFWSGAADASLQAWAAYDQNAFYLAARVWDTHLLSNYRSAANVWNGDALELYLSGSEQDLAGRGVAYLAGDFRLGIGYGQVALVDITRGQPVLGATIATRSTTDGYTLELHVPFSSLNGLAPWLNREIGFDLALDDADDTASRESLLVWSGTSLVASDVREMGIALLAGSQVVPATNTPTASPSATASSTTTPTRMPTLTASPTATATPTPTPSRTPSATSTPGIPTVISSATPTPIPTITVTGALPTVTPTQRPSATPTATLPPAKQQVRLPMVLRGRMPGQAP